MIANFDDIQYRRIGYTALDIATPSNELIYWDRGSDPHDTIQQARERDVTHIPVRINGQIRGRITLDSLMRGEQDFEPLTSEQLISHDTPILHVIDLFAEKDESIFFVLSSNELTGLIAPADLNKVPALASVYLLVAEFETSLIKLIKEKLGNDDKLIEQLLDQGRRSKIKKYQKQARDKYIDLPLIHYAGLKDLVTIATKSESLHKIIPKKLMENEKAVASIVEMRDAVAHTGNQIISSRNQIKDISDNIELLIRGIKHIKKTSNSPGTENN